MKQVVQSLRNGRVSVRDVPAPILRPEGVLVHTRYSVISAGTERAKTELASKSLLGKALARPEQVKRVIEGIQEQGLAATITKVRNRLDTPAPLGYSLSGVVTAVGQDVADICVGARVACGGAGHANHSEVVYVPRTLCALVPAEVHLEEAAYGTIAAISLQGVRQTAPMLGETVAVIGLGLIGLITVQLLRASGCLVVGIDPNPTRRQLARSLGAELVFDSDEARTEAPWLSTAPNGVDAVILTAATASNDPIELAGDMARDRARVVVVGDVSLQVPRDSFYMKELDLRLSRSYGPGRYDKSHEEGGHDYPIGYVRWTEGRNIAAVLELLRQKKLDVKLLTTDRFPIAEATAAYQRFGDRTKSPIGIVLEYAQADFQISPKAGNQRSTTPARDASGTVGVSVIGTGNFLRGSLLPPLSRRRDTVFRGAHSATGLGAMSLVERMGFEYAAPAPSDIFADTETDLVMIASRHDSHARLAVMGIAAGKAVFVEKPLALNRDELAEVVAACEEHHGWLMVGFNRRFAPLVLELKSFIEQLSEPLVLNYRINAGFVARDHWVQTAEGGGRIRGEVCHFVDLTTFLVGASPVEVVAYALPDEGRYSRDNLSTMIRYENGSVGVVTYLANCNRNAPKERIEISVAGRSAVLDDFRSLTLMSSHERVSKSRLNKGHAEEMATLITAVREGRPSPTTLKSLVATTLMTLAVEESILTGAPVALSL